MPKSNRQNSQTINAQGRSKIQDVVQLQAEKIINTIIMTGGQNFSGEYSYLREDYIKPDSVFSRVQLENFTGRDWLFDKVESFIQNDQNGYFVLEAKAGLGKTTFLAHLVKKWKCIHHFVELAPGKEGLSAGLKNIIAQLMLAWTIQPSESNKVMLGRAPRPDYLQEFLFEVARIRDEKHPDEKIVIVVDALDEAGTPDGLNVLGLPKTLPNNVFFIVSQRPVEITLDVEQRTVFRLTPESADNLADMSLYLFNTAKWSGISKELRKQNYTDEYYVSTLLNKCKGIWIYLHYVTKEIEMGTRCPLNLELLPHGVWQYYAQYWRRWRGEHREQWNGVHLPLLATMAALQEETTLSLICKFTEIDENQVGHLLKEKWSPFLTESSSKFRLYHASLQEFLDGRADPNDLMEQEIVFIQELAEATRRAHLRIARIFLDEWGGLENNLPLLLEREKREIYNNYGIRFIASHLEKGGTDGAGIFNSLLSIEWVASHLSSAESDFTISVSSPNEGKNFNGTDNYVNAWYVANDLSGDTTSYLNSIEKAWNLAISGESAVASTVDLQCRYALIKTTIRSLALKIHPSLLSSLVTKEVWPPEKALAYAIQVPDKRHQAYAIAELIPIFEGPLLTEAFLSIPRGMDEEVIKYISAAILNIDDSNQREQIVNKISEYIPGDILSDLRDKTRKLKNLGEQQNSFRISSESLPPTLSRRFFRHFDLRETANNIQKKTREFDDDYEEFSENIRKIGLTNFEEWPFKPAEKKKRTRSELNEILDLWDSDLRAYKLVKLAYRITEDGKQRVINEALKTIKSLTNEMDKAILLSLLGGISNFPDESMAEMTEILSTINDAAFRTHIFSVFGHRVPIEYLEQEILMISRSKDENFKAKVLSNLIPHLNKGLLYNILSTVSSINDVDKRLYSLIYLQSNLDKQDQKKLAAIILPLLESTENSPLKPKMEILSAKLFGDIQDDNYLNKLFQNVGKLPEEDKAESIKFLAPYLPEKFLGEALITGVVMRSESSQTIVFEATIPLLKFKVLEKAVYSVIENFDRWYPGGLLRGLALLSSFLPEKLRVVVHKFVFAEVFDRYISEDADEDEDADIDEPSKSEENSDTIPHEISVDSDSLVALAIIANCYPPAQEVLSKCKWVKNRYDLAVFLIKIGFLRKGFEREEIFLFVLDLSKQIEDEKELSNVLALLVPHLSQNNLISCFETAIGIKDDFNRFFILNIIDEFISKFPKQILNSLFCEGLFVMASRSRNSLLMDLGALNKTINSLGGSRGTSEVCGAIQDVGRWWP